MYGTVRTVVWEPGRVTAPGYPINLGGKGGYRVALPA